MTAQDFRALPLPDTAAGEPRRVGMELEFTGMTEGAAAEVTQGLFGGHLTQGGEFSIELRDSEIGEVSFILDASVRKYGDNRLVHAGLDAARAVVPIEIVTEPLTMHGLARLDALCDILRQNGAKGTDAGILYGFGVHFNVAVVAPDDPFTCDTILAFGVLEDWLRRHLDPIDETRRLMPYVDPWPRDMVLALAKAGVGASVTTQREIYAKHANSRNYGLDLLPLYKAADGAEFERIFPDQAETKERPAYHFRLPDCRISDPDWSLAQEWHRWWLVEKVADDPALLSDLAKDFASRSPKFFTDRQAWADRVAERIGAQGERL